MNAHLIHIHANNPAPTHLDPTIAAVTLVIVNLVPTAMVGLQNVITSVRLLTDIFIDECLLNGGLGPCQHMCTNTIGSFYCSCRSGYTQPSGVYYCKGGEITLLMYTFTFTKYYYIRCG